MKILKSFKFKHALSAVGAVGLFSLLASAGCSSTDGTGTPTSCTGLSATSHAQTTLKAYGQAAGALNTAAKNVEAKWLTLCNAINADLGEDASQTTASKACAVLDARVKKALVAGVTVNLTVKSECHAQASVVGDCEAQCQLPTCDIKAKCEPGKVVVGCMGTCDAACDVQGPSVNCMGSCSGSCTATAAVTCQGQCTGECSDLTWSGTCDAGCTANFSGSCGGTCMGMCDGQNSTATCNGKCEGTCSANASGSCSAKCTGKFSGGCKANCTGSCAADVAAQCNGKCEGTCSVTAPSATCTGECHGKCSAETTPPSCTGSIDCEGSADCHASCQASATASASCTSSATLVVDGDAKLYNSINAHLNDLKAAFALTVALKDPVANLAGKTAASFSALGDIGVQGAGCFASSLQLAAEASVSINVSVQASASVQGKASAG